MIRCENCGHKLNDNQKICDVCGKPVRQKSSEDIELEAELAKSIAQIVENETTDAQVYLKEMQGSQEKGKQMSGRGTGGDVLGVSQRSSDRTGQNTQPRSNGTQPNGNTRSKNSAQSRGASSSRQEDVKYVQGNGTKRPAAKRKKNKAGKIAAIAAIVIVVVAALIMLAFFTINSVLKKAQNNFAYYNNMGIEYVQSQKYDEAIPYLEKALTFDEAQNKINLRFSLYDCYAATGDTQRAISMLYNILQIDQYNLEAIVYLENYYEQAGVTEALVELYNKYKDTQAADAVAKYYVAPPAIAVEGGEYTTDLEVKITSDYGYRIYYTTDGSEPTVNSSLYGNKIDITEGTTMLKCIAVNDYNIASEVVSAEYKIEYKAPDAPTISPRSGNYETEQLIVIGNIPAGGKAYYTLDNTTPTNKSTLYTGPFDMPSGNNVLSVITYDKNGQKSAVVKRNYVLKLEDKVSQERALEILWQAMEHKNMVDSQHLSSDGEPVKLVLDEKKTILGHSIWVFDIYVSAEQGDLKANYQMGVDSEDSYVYTVYENNGVYTLDEVIY